MKEYKKPLVEVIDYSENDILTDSQDPPVTDPPVNTCTGFFTYSGGSGGGGDNPR